jgi:hypothetical protein
MDYDSEYVFDHEISSHDFLDEDYEHTQYAYDLDEGYARDSTDYAHLAYVHYA